MKKRLLAVVLVLAMCLSLSACGLLTPLKIRAANKAVNELPPAEYIELQDEELIANARKAVDSLDRKYLGKIENLSNLIDCEARLDVLKKETALREQIVGSWMNLYGDSYATQSLRFDDDMSCLCDGVRGTWQMNLDYATVDVVDSYGGGILYDLHTEEVAGDTRLTDGYSVFVRAEDYDRIRDQMFVTVQINRENFSQYMTFTRIGNQEDSSGQPFGSTYMFTSNVYSQGLILYSVSEDFYFEAELWDDYHEEGYTPFTWTISRDYPFAVVYAWDAETYDLTAITAARGTLTFIRSQYVSENYADNDGDRVLVLADGRWIYDFDCPFWDSEIATTYDEWKY